MRFQITKQVGKSTVVFSDELKDLKEFFVKASTLGEVLPSVCGHCGGEDIVPSHRSVKGNSYYEVGCRDIKCGWRLKLGQRKDDGQLFPKEWEPPYSKNDAPAAEYAEDDVPF